MKKSEADEVIERIATGLAVEGNVIEARIKVVAFITTLLMYWTFKTKAHKMDCLGMIEMVKDMIDEQDWVEG